MQKPRASIFEQSPDLDVTGFAPKPSADATAPTAEAVRAVSQAAQFRSRESAAPAEQKESKRWPRRYRTGRNVQLSLKARKEAVEAFYSVAEAKGWVLGYTLERAVEALQRELGKAE